MVHSLYIHFPFCTHLCNYCDFYKHKLVSSEQISDFQKKLSLNIKSNEELLEKNSMKIGPLETIYIGGGTPSLWGTSGANFIEKELIERYQLASEAEFTIEVDPDNWSEDQLLRWIEIGVNRFSVGAQSYDTKMIKLMDRQHTRDEISLLLSFLKKMDLNFSIDLMLGLPFSNENARDVSKELEEFISFGPSHFSVYILKTRKNYPHNDHLPSEAYIESEYLSVCELLTNRGYEQYEVSNFAKNKAYSKHNLKYWNSESVAALGSNATGLLNTGDEGLRYQWKSYSGGVSEEQINKESFLIEKVYMGLRSHIGFDFSNFDQSKMELLYESWLELGYIKSRENKTIFLSSKGYLMLDSLMNDMFSHGQL